MLDAKDKDKAHRRKCSPIKKFFKNLTKKYYKKVGRLVTKGDGLGPDNKKWVGSDQDRVASDNPRSEICVKYLVSAAFFRQIYEKTGITKIQYIG